MDAVPGWLNPEDALIMSGIAGLQAQKGIAGDILEIGVFQGKSAILLGHLLAPDEHLTVCDLFESRANTSSNQREQRLMYPGLERSQFERNFKRFHPALPRVLQCSSSELGSMLDPESYRFIHIDGSHLYDSVRHEALLARDLLVPGGIVAFDDYSNPEFLGVAAAAWETIFKTKMVPLCVTDAKLYAGWETNMRVPIETANAWVGPLRRTTVEVITVFGHPVIRIGRTRSYLRRALEKTGLARQLAQLRLSASRV
jgi:hypothetical protein